MCIEVNSIAAMPAPARSARRSGPPPKADSQTSRPDRRNIPCSVTTPALVCRARWCSAGVCQPHTTISSTTDSGTGGIWNITVNQSSPSVLTSVGIFKVDGDNMQYEVAQTEPNIGAIPPTAAGGFGSTNGGALGTQNVQKYVRVN